MVRYGQDGLPIATDATQAAAWHKSVRVTCPNGHSTVFNGDGFWWLCVRRNLPTGFVALRARLYCRACWHRGCSKVHPRRIEACADQPDTMLPHPPESEARAAAKRFR